MRALSLLLPALLPLALAGPARAGLPDNSCFLAAGPGSSAAVERLTLRIHPLNRRDRVTGAPWRYARLSVVMSARGQGLADGVQGKPLTQSLVCRSDTGMCEAAERAATLALRPAPGGGLVLTTRDMPVADYGESDLASNLAHPPGTPVRFDLAPAPLDACREP